MKHRTFLISFFCAASVGAVMVACSSNSGTAVVTTDAGKEKDSGPTKDSGVKLGQIGDDCATDTACASGLCGNDGSCAKPVASLDGGKCSVAADCPKGDLCEASKGRCYAPPSDAAVNAATPCTTNADCHSDETCGKNHTCQG
jgi:hypothetical protein